MSNHFVLVGSSSTNGNLVMILQLYWKTVPTIAYMLLDGPNALNI